MHVNFLILAEEAFKRGWPKQPDIPQDYHTYINSVFWDERKRRYFQFHQKQCVLCYTRRHIDLHHLSYYDLGNELDEDLVPLCRAHHQHFHLLYGSAKDMYRQWREFVRYNEAYDRRNQRGYHSTNEH